MLNNKKVEDLLRQETEKITVKRFDRVFSTPLQQSSLSPSQKVTSDISKDKVSAQSDAQIGSPQSEPQARLTKSRFGGWRFGFGALAACAVMICAMLLTFLPQNSVNASNLTSYIIEINPSFCITADSENSVVSVCALNDDADTVMGDSTFDSVSGMTLSDCLSKIVEITFDKGFFDNYPSGKSITLYAVNNKSDFAKEKADFAKGLLEEDLKNFSLENIGVAQSFMNLDDFKGKMQFEGDFSDLDKFLGELQDRRYFNPDFVPPDVPPADQPNNPPTDQSSGQPTDSPTNQSADQPTADTPSTDAPTSDQLPTDDAQDGQTSKKFYNFSNKTVSFSV